MTTLDEARATGTGTGPGSAPSRASFGRRLLANRRTCGAGAFLLFVVIVAAAAPLIAPHDYRDLIGTPLSSAGVLGTDDFGRDVLSRLIVGTRTSLVVAASAVAVSALIGVALGLVAGYFGRWASAVIMRSIDVLLSFPPIVLAIAVVAALGPAMINVVMVIGVLYIPRFTRLVHDQVKAMRSMEYVEAAKLMGAPNPHILVRTVLPNVAAPVIVQLSLSMSFAIQLEAGLSFLGLGSQPPLPSLGTMISTGRNFLEVQPSLLVWPSVFIVLVVLALNVFGDGMRDLLDPRRRGNS